MDLLTLDEAKERYKKRYRRPEFGLIGLEEAKRRQTEMISEGPALSRGFDVGMTQQNPELIAASMEASSYQTDDPNFRDLLTTTSEAFAGMVSEDAPQLRGKRMSELSSVDDYMTWLGEGVGRGVASLTIPAAGAVAGGAAARRMGAGKIGQKFGMAAGGAFPAWVLNHGELYSALKDAGVDPQIASDWANIGSGPLTALDLVGIGGIVKNLTGSARKQMARHIARRIAEEGAEGFLREGGTEGAQEFIIEAIKSYHTGEPIDMESVAEAAVIGGFTGGGVQALTGLTPDRQGGPGGMTIKPPGDPGVGGPPGPLVDPNQRQIEGPDTIYGGQDTIYQPGPTEPPPPPPPAVPAQELDEGLIPSESPVEPPPAPPQQPVEAPEPVAAPPPPESATGPIEPVEGYPTPLGSTQWVTQDEPGAQPPEAVPLTPATEGEPPSGQRDRFDQGEHVYGSTDWPALRIFEFDADPARRVALDALKAAGGERGVIAEGLENAILQASEIQGIDAQRRFVHGMDPTQSGIISAAMYFIDDAIARGATGADVIEEGLAERLAAGLHKEQDFEDQFDKEPRAGPRAPDEPQATIPDPTPPATATLADLSDEVFGPISTTAIELPRGIGDHARLLLSDEELAALAGVGITPSQGRDIFSAQDVDAILRDRARRIRPAAEAPTAPPPVPTITAPAPAEPEAEAPTLEAGLLADRLAEQLKYGNKITADYLFGEADRIFGGTQGEGAYTPKDAYDALELAVNKYAMMYPEAVDPRADADTARTMIESIGRLVDRLPTQTRRTEESSTFQQFSTPPHYSYLGAWVANMGPNDTMLEPSAGTGSFVVHALNAGVSKVWANELSPRRAEFLREIGVTDVFTEDAEQLNNILPKDVKPTVILMNPPFSTTGGRMGAKKVPQAGVRHVDQALKRLAPGGRLVAILGRPPERFGGKEPMWMLDWLARTQRDYDVRALIDIPGEVYSKYGTSYPTRLYVIDKTQTGVETIQTKVESLVDAVAVLEGIRNDRATLTEQPPAEPTGEGTALPSGGGTAARPDVRGPVPPMGPGRAGEGRPAGGGTATGGGGVPGGVGPGEGAQGAGAGGVGAPRPTGGLGSGGDVDGGTAGRAPDGDAAGLPGVPPRGIEVKATEQAPDTSDITDEIFEEYTPQRLSVKGAKPHPGKLVQSAAMAAVLPPEPTYSPKLPRKTITEGKVSLPQLEGVVYAGQAHETILPDGTRKALMLGDGPGVGKGRQIAAVIHDNYLQGRKKAVWLSAKRPLIGDARRDTRGIGGNVDKLIDFGKINVLTDVPHKEGTLFVTYGALRAKSSKTVKNEDGEEVPAATRLDQITKWLGPDFEGVLVFDEAHKMGNAIEMAGSQGKKRPSQTALAGAELKSRFPMARVMYASATGATEVENLAYGDGLGLWGRGTPFTDARDFVGKIQEGGIAAMELVARDMKAMGTYVARTLSYDGVEYDRTEHVLTPDQRNTYNTLAEGWQEVLAQVERAMAETGAKHWERAQFWNSHQRFFSQVITSMQMPSVLKAADKDLADGMSVIIQLVKTNEATQERQAAKVETDDDLDRMDMSPKQTLLEWIDKFFPVQQFEDYVDDNGNPGKRPVLDSSGKPVLNQEAVDMRDALMERVEKTLHVPAGPLDMIIEHFGKDNVAEITGRKRRLIKDKDGKSKWESRGTPQNTNVVELAAFQGAKKRVAALSDAGGTGSSAHAALDEENQQRRSHYLVEPGWVAANALQGLGRSHRSNQASAPIYHLVTTDLKAQKRFVSSIARRLDQLGALTKGQRQAGAQGLFKEGDNLETDYARDAVRAFYVDLARDKVDGITLKEYERQTGLSLTKDGALRNTLPDIKKFLNRLLSMKIEMQDLVFEAFDAIHQDNVARAISEGTLDVGVETVRADYVKKVDEQVVYTHPETGAETKYVHLLVGNRTKPRSYNEVAGRGLYFVRNKRSGNLWRVLPASDRTSTLTGKVTPQYRLLGPASFQFIPQRRLDKRDQWEMVRDSDARSLWAEQIEKLPEFIETDEHLITGVILPIWDRLEGDTRVYRVRTDEGEKLLGRRIDPADVRATLNRLGAEMTAPDISLSDALKRVMAGDRLRLANGWTIERRRVSGENRVEIRGDQLLNHKDTLIAEGAFLEKISYETRFFIPTGPQGVVTLGKVTEHRPIVEIVGQHGQDAKLSEAPHPQDNAVMRSRREIMRIANEIEKIARRIAPQSASKTPYTMGEYGLGPRTQGAYYYDENIMMAALSGLDPEMTIRHEGIHALYELNLFTKEEWALLNRRAKEWRKRHDIDRRYPSLKGQEDNLNEEAIADGFKGWAEGKRTVPPAIERLFERIRRFLASVGNWLRGRGYQNIKDLTDAIFAKVESGEIGERPSPGRRREGVRGREPAMASGWHGSPYDFDQFDIGKIGTGEGHQMIAWGLYFGGIQEVGEHYRDELSWDANETRLTLEDLRTLNQDPEFPDNVPMHVFDEDLLDPHSNGTVEISWRGVIEEIDAYGEDGRSYVEDLHERYRFDVPYHPSRLYEVDLAPAEDEYLLWDVPLAEQSASVRKALEQIFPSFAIAQEGAQPWVGGLDDLALWTGRDFYQALSGESSVQGGDKAASIRLRDLGVPGVKYLDQFSRTPGSRRMLVKSDGSPGVTTTEMGLRPAVRMINNSTVEFSTWDEMRSLLLASIKEYEGSDFRPPTLALWMGDRVDDMQEQVADIDRLEAEGYKIWTADPTYNYVIFDDSNIKVKAKFDEGPAEEGPTGDHEATRRDRLWQYIAETFEFAAPLGHLEKAQEYMVLRWKTIGRLTKVEEVAERMNRLRKATPQDREAIFTYLTTKNADPMAIKSERFRKLAVSTKSVIIKVGDRLVAEGLLSEEVVEQHKGEYLTRVYLKYLWSADKGGYLNPRHDIPEDIRRLQYGEIKEPGFLAAKSYLQPMQDLITLGHLRRVMGESAWTFPHQFAEWRGKKVTAYWLKAEAERLRDQIKLFPEQDQSAVKQRAAEMDDVAREALAQEKTIFEAAEAQGKKPKDYKRIPNERRYGMFRGMWVRREIFNDLIGASQIVKDGEGSVAERIMGHGRMLTKAVQLWKLGKVAMNPPTQGRNFAGNGILLNLSGVPLPTLPVYVGRALNEMINGGKHWKIAKKYGVKGTTFRSAEMYKFKRKFEREMLESKDRHPLRMLMNAGLDFANMAGDLYGLSEALFKTASIIHSMTRLDLNEEQAAAKAHRYLFDYTLVPASVQYLRNAPIGVPFLTYQYKVASVLLETAIKAPWRFAPYLALPFIFAAMIADEYDVDDDDVDALNESMSTWMRESGSVAILPWKDDRGFWQAWNYEYIMPWGLPMQLLRQASRGHGFELIDTLLQMTGPVVQGMVAINNRDPFFKREIWNNSDPLSYRIADGLAYASRLLLPSWLTDRGAAEKLLDALNKEKDRYGNERRTVVQAALGMVGISLYAIDPELSRDVNISRMERQLRDVEKRRDWVTSADNITDAERENEEATYQDTIDYLFDELNRYMDESEIPEALQVETPMQ